MRFCTSRFYLALIAGAIVLALHALPVYAVTCPLRGDSKEIKEIGGSCEAIMDPMDATEMKREAFDICCKSAQAYLDKSPIPCGDRAKIRHRVQLALAVCDMIKAPELDYEHDYCIDQMLYHIIDPKVLEIADKCSPSGGKAPPSRRGAKSDGAKDKAKESGDTAKPGDAAKSDHPHGKWTGKGGGKDGAEDPSKPPDLHMDDESYSKCQRERLDKYLAQLNEEIEKNPSERGDCSQTAPQVTKTAR